MEIICLGFILNLQLRYVKHEYLFIHLIFLFFQAYLSLPEGIASVAGLIAMMIDHYSVIVSSLFFVKTRRDVANWMGQIVCLVNLCGPVSTCLW